MLRCTMLRCAMGLIGLCLLAGCGETVVSTKPAPVNTTPVAPAPGGEDSPLPPETPLTPGENKPLPQPPQVFASPDDAALAALANAPLADLVAQLGEVKSRSLASRALALRGAAAVDPLLAALASEDAGVRAAAAFALGQLGKDGATAAAALKKAAADDRDETVRVAALFALDALEGK